MTGENRSWVPWPTSTRDGAIVAADQRPWITDEFLESWVRWREACEDVGGA